MNDTMIDRIYEAAAIPELWPDVIHDMSRQHGFVGGVLITANDANQTGMCSEGIREAFDVFVRDGWAARNERGRRAIARGYQGFGRADDLFTEDEKAKEPVYTELYHRFGLDDSAGTFISCPNGDNVILSFERAKSLGRTPDETLVALDVFRPILGRAALVSGRLDVERAKAQVAALSIFGLPATVTTSNGRALASNAEFDAFSAHASIGAFDRLSLHDKVAGAQLAEVFEGADRIQRLGRSIALRADGQRAAAVLHVLPIRRAARDVFSRAAWLIAITPAGSQAAPDADILGALFDLTPAEARVTKSLLTGRDLKEIANEYGVSIVTVRNQIASIFAKTGATRQSELILMCRARLPKIEHA